MAAKFYIVKPEYTRHSEDVPFSITGVQFRVNGNGVPTAYDNRADARSLAGHLYANCGWVAPLVVAASASTAAERRAIAAEKALRCYAGEITIREAGTL